MIIAAVLAGCSAGAVELPEPGPTKGDTVTQTTVELVERSVIPVHEMVVTGDGTVDGADPDRTVFTSDAYFFPGRDDLVVSADSDYKFDTAGGAVALALSMRPMGAESWTRIGYHDSERVVDLVRDVEFSPRDGADEAALTLDGQLIPWENVVTADGRSAGPDAGTTDWEFKVFVLPLSDRGASYGFVLAGRCGDGPCSAE